MKRKTLTRNWVSCYIKHMKTIQSKIREIIQKKKLSIYQVAQAIGVDHGNLYRSLSDGSNLELNTMLKVLSYLGYEIQLVKSKGKEAKPRKLKPSKSRRRKGD